MVYIKQNKDQVLLTNIIYLALYCLQKKWRR